MNTKLFVLIVMLCYLGQVVAQTPLLTQATAWAKTTKPTFEENKGQIRTPNNQPNQDVQFVYKHGGLSVFLLKTGIAYQFQQADKMPAPVLPSWNSLPIEPAYQRIELKRIDMELVGANPNAKITTTGKSHSFTNYYNRNVLGVYQFEKITYHDIYPHIDWVIYTTDKGMKYDFIVRPQGNPAHIQLQFRNHDELKINPDGALQIKTSMGAITEQSPVSYQQNTPIHTQFATMGDIVRFDLAAYDTTQIIIIDPQIEWATYYGGESSDFGSCVAIDGMGNVYLLGRTYSTQYIATGGHQTAIRGDADIFIVKFNANGQRQWATYYGGANHDGVTDCVSDSVGNIYLVGSTHSDSNIAHHGEIMSLPGYTPSLPYGYNGGFWAKFDANGVLQWGTYETFNKAYVGSISLDKRGRIWGVGSYDPNDYVTHAYNGFIVGRNTDGETFYLYSWGTPAVEHLFDCAIDADGNLFAAGVTNYGVGWAINGHQMQSGGGACDAFLMKLNAQTLTFDWATYYGGSKMEISASCTVDKEGNVYLCGITESPDNITYNGAHDSMGAWQDGYLVKFNANGVRQWGTYTHLNGVGSAYNSTLSSAATDSLNNVYVVGTITNATNIGLNNPNNAYHGSDDGYIMKFGSDGTPRWGVYFGGDSSDVLNKMAINQTGDIYAVGTSASPTNIATNAYQNTLNNTNDAILVKYAARPTYYSYNHHICMGETYDFNGILLSQAGTYMDTTTNTIGCDSIEIVNLAVTDLAPQIQQQDDTLWATANNATQYQWVNCITNQPIRNATQPTFVVPHSGQYAVSVSDGVCSILSSCMQVVSFHKSNQLFVYPNPAGAYLIVQPNEPLNDATISIYKADGTLAHQLEHISGAYYQYNTQSLMAGMYSIRITQQTQTISTHFIKQ